MVIKMGSIGVIAPKRVIIEPKSRGIEPKQTIIEPELNAPITILWNYQMSFYKYSPFL
jgi:hypothetical protein